MDLAEDKHKPRRWPCHCILTMPQAPCPTVTLKSVQQHLPWQHRGSGSKGVHWKVFKSRFKKPCISLGNILWLCLSTGLDPAPKVPAGEHRCSGTAPTPRPWGGWGRSFHPSKTGARAEPSYKKRAGREVFK